MSASEHTGRLLARELWAARVDVRAAAEHLGMSPNTVEIHLRQEWPPLGVVLPLLRLCKASPWTIDRVSRAYGRTGRAAPFPNSAMAKSHRTPTKTKAGPPDANQRGRLHRGNDDSK